MDKEYSETSLHELKERVEKLEESVDFLLQWRELEDMTDREYLKQMEIIVSCISKQKEWNAITEEAINLLNQLINIKTGGQK